MKEMTSVSANFMLIPTEDDSESNRLRGHAEIVLVLSEPKYTVDESGSLVKHRTTDSLRFTTSAKGMRHLAEVLTKLADDLDTTCANYTHIDKPTDTAKEK